MLRSLTRKRRKTLIACLVLAVSAGLGLPVLKSFSGKQSTRLKKVNVQHPDQFGAEFDPRRIRSLGEYVLGEHVLGFHVRNSPEAGIQPMLSEVEFDREKKLIVIKPRFPIRSASGEEFSEEDLCRSLNASFQGTTHSQLGEIISKTVCSQGVIRIELKAFPVNLPFLLGVVDFSISNPDHFPSSSDQRNWSTGPYYIADRQPKQVILRKNKYYPPELNANEAEEVIFNSYSVEDVGNGLRTWNPSIDHLIYLLSPAASDSQLNKMRSSGYNLRIYPDEGLLYVSFFGDLDIETREVISRSLDDIKSKVVKEQSFLHPAYSVFPADREFGLSEQEYKEALGTTSIRKARLKKKLILGMIPQTYGVPALKAVCDALIAAFPDQIELKIYPPGSYKEFKKEVDLTASWVAISAADPLSDLYYLHEYAPAMQKAFSPKDLHYATYEEDSTAFTKRIKAIETKLARQRSFFPIAHYPGIVAESPLLERVEELSWAWGAPAWSYRVR